MDKIIRGITKDGFVKISAINGRDLVQRAREIHNTTPTATAALGRMLCAASMLGNLMKEEDAAVTLRINGGGPINGVLAVSDSTGNVRGYVGDPTVDLPLRPDGKLDVGGAVGKDGMLTVSKDIGLREPYIGSTEIVSGEIAEDVAAYMTDSEQIPAAVGLGVLVDTDCSVAQAGALASLAAADELMERTEETVAVRDQVADELGALRSEANFVWLPGVDAAKIAAAMAEQNVLVRAFPEGVRVTVTTEDEAQQVIAAWRAAGL